MKPSPDVHAECRGQIGTLEAALEDALGCLLGDAAVIKMATGLEDMTNQACIDRLRWVLGEGP